MKIYFFRSNYLEDFDSNVSKILKYWHLKESDVRDKFREKTGLDIGDVSYSHAVKINRRLAENIKLFGSAFFSAMLKTLELNQENKRLQRIVRAILELLVGSYGQRLIARLNEELFEEAPEELSVFDDLSGVFSLNYKNIGQTGMEMVLDDIQSPISSNDTLVKIMSELGRTVLEDIYSKAIDYQALIDSHFRYLYNPKAHWAKFTRISIFLHTVRRYIKTCSNIDINKINNGPGYYHDLLLLSEHADIEAIGTTNYNTFIEQVFDLNGKSNIPVFHLNGSVDEYYDPYCNTILLNYTEEQLASYEHIVVPFLFTQSGVKPLTSITMSKRYVELYERFKESDIICIVGYGFNGDDGHINGLFRSLAVEGKKLVVFHFGNDNQNFLKKEYQTKLRLGSSHNIDIFTVDDSRNTNDNKAWWKSLIDNYVLLPN
ncbi:hypothetical protein [Cohnella massiliensis]|uniref:hypothetical protein n=1 Tax=Cohnella massiliensis TaxID=1816691 RepID=UPI001BC8C002|nr:hypothetical protein [Cohnella massiliensis]